MIIKSVTKTHSSGKLWLLAGVILIAGAGYVFISRWYSPATIEPITINKSADSQSIKSNPVSENTKAENSEPTDSLPEQKLLSVPFTPQAPTANWDELHNEACEEASSLMTDAYFSNLEQSALTPEYAEQEIAKLTQWQKDNFGYYLDITTEETAKMITEVYGLKTEVIKFPDEQAIKEQLVKNHLVVFSTNGRKLGNPNYKQPGPIHHMLLIKGYNKVGFITNDSGTKKGLNYAYTYDTLKAAAADWDHSKETVDENIKLAIIISKQ